MLQDSSQNCGGGILEIFMRQPHNAICQIQSRLSPIELEKRKNGCFFSLFDYSKSSLNTFAW